MWSELKIGWLGLAPRQENEGSSEISGEIVNIEEPPLLYPRRPPHCEVTMAKLQGVIEAKLVHREPDTDQGRSDRGEDKQREEDVATEHHVEHRWGVVVTEGTTSSSELIYEEGQRKNEWRTAAEGETEADCREHGMPSLQRGIYE
jgi:hypothetical protein